MQAVRNDLGFMADRIDGLGKVGQRLSFAVTLPLTLAAGAIVSTTAEFQAAMYNVASISTDVAANFDEMSAKVLEFGANTRSGAQAAAEALYEVYSVGYRGDAFELMTVSVRTAEAGLADLATTTRALANVLNAYPNAAMTASDASNVLTRTVQLGAGTLDEYASNLGRVAPVASALGISFSELGANWAFITQQGAGVGVAATELSGIMNKLLKPSEDLAGVFDQLGVSGGIELIDKFGGLQGAVTALYDAVGDNPERFAEIFGDVRAIRGILKMSNSIEEWGAAIDEFNAGLDTATMSAWEQQSMSMSASFGRLLSAAQGVAIYIGQQFIPVLQPLVDGFTQVVLTAMDLDPALIQVGAAFAVAVAAAGPLLWLLSSMLTPVGVLIGAVAALATAVSVNFGNIRTTIENAVNAVFGDVSGLSGGLQTIIDAIFDTGGAQGGAIEGPMQQWASENQVEVGASTFITVDPGDTLWGIWNDNFRDVFDWEEFKDIAGFANPNLIHPGDIIEIPATAAAEMRDAVQSGFDFENAFKIDPNDWSSDPVRPLQKDLGTRVSEAVKAAWPQISEALGSILTSIGNWITATAIPGIAHGLGTIVGGIGRAIGEAIGSIGKFLEGKQGGNLLRELWDYFGTYVWQPFVEGLESQLGDLDVGNAIVTTIAGLIGTALAGSILINTLKTGVTSAVASAFSGGIITKGVKGLLGIGASIANWISMELTGLTVVNVVKTAIMTLLTSAAAAVTGGILLGAGISFLIPEETKRAFRSALDDLVTDVTGIDTSFTTALNQEVERGLSNALAGVFDIAGRPDVANSLRANAEAIADSYRADVTESLNNGGPITPSGPLIIQGPSVQLTQPQFDTQWSSNLSVIGQQASKNFADGILLGWRDNENDVMVQLNDGITRMWPTADGMTAIVQPVGEAAISGYATGLSNGITTNAANIQWAADAMVTPVQDTVTEGFGPASPILSTVIDFASNYADEMTRIGDATAGVSEPVSTGLGNLLNSIITFAGSIIARVLAIAGAFKEMVDAASAASNVSMPSTVGVHANGGGRAIGGPVTAGVPYTVGEHGIETFIPNVSGVIQPAAATSRNMSRKVSPAQQVQNVFYIYGVRDVDGFVRETKRRGWQQ